MKKIRMQYKVELSNKNEIKIGDIDCVKMLLESIEKNPKNFVITSGGVINPSFVIDIVEDIYYTNVINSSDDYVRKYLESDSEFIQIVSREKQNKLN